MNIIFIKLNTQVGTTIKYRISKYYDALTNSTPISRSFRSW